MDTHEIEAMEEKIINGINPEWDELTIVRYVYIELGKILCKNVTFFYSLDNKLGELNYSFDQIKYVYESGMPIDYEAVCTSAANSLKRIYDKLGITSTIRYYQKGYDYIDPNNDSNIETIIHSFLSVTTKDGHSYFLTLVPDLFNIQFGLQTKHFGSNISYKVVNPETNEEVQLYQGEEADITILTEEELLAIDRKIGYARKETHNYNFGTGKLIDNGYNDFMFDILNTNSVASLLNYNNILASMTTFNKTIYEYFDHNGVVIDLLELEELFQARNDTVLNYLYFGNKDTFELSQEEQEAKRKEAENDTFNILKKKELILTIGYLLNVIPYMNT